MPGVTYVFDFDEPSPGGRELLGGKGIGLAEMTRMGLPVPQGFTITTDACRAYLAAGALPDGLEQELAQHLETLEERTGKRFGDPNDPLLVSVRSGAAVSMPGMMDTILNLGLNDEATEGLAARTGNRRFAYDSYRRLLQMFGEVVDGIDAQAFEDALSELKQERGAAQDTDLTAEDLEVLVARFKEIYPAFPNDAAIIVDYGYILGQAGRKPEGLRAQMEEFRPSGVEGAPGVRMSLRKPGSEGRE